jgi:flagellar hook-basal body complex protein FliE
MATPLGAASAYAKLARLTTGGDGLGGLGGAAGAGADKANGPTFSAALKDALGSVMEAGHKSDAQSQAMVAGKANIIDVVTAVSESEVAVDALVAVRDRVIQAYEEIMKMQI